MVSSRNIFTFSREDLAVANVRVQSQIIREGNEENHEKSQSRKPWAEEVDDDE
jgi:hypothetical protein